MTDTVGEYFDALSRLINGHPVRVPRGSKINNDTVALEAGRKRGSIKNGRPAHHGLIAAIIDASSKLEHQGGDDVRAKYEKTKAKANEYRHLWETAIVRELSLLHELHECKRQLKFLNNKVVSI